MPVRLPNVYKTDLITIYLNKTVIRIVSSIDDKKKLQNLLQPF